MRLRRSSNDIYTQKSTEKGVPGMKAVPALPARGIFISYRRADAGSYARLLQVELSEHFPNAPVFLDLDSIEAGLDFAEVIRDAIDSCLVMVVLIGPQWATLTDDRGCRRLDDPHDYVRFEIRTALKRGVRTIPVLVDGAKPVRKQQLPHDLHRLARLNALEMSYDRYRFDADRLIAIVGRLLAAEVRSAAPQDPAVPPVGGSEPLQHPALADCQAEHGQTGRFSGGGDWLGHSR